MKGAPLDPRIRLALVVSLSGLILFVGFPRVLILILPVTVMAWGTLPPSRRMALGKSIALLASVTLVVGAWWGGSRQGVAWYQPTPEGLELGGLQALRLAGLASMMAWGVERLSMWRLTQSLEWSARNHPERRFRVHRAVFPLVLAWQLIPALWGETRRHIAVHRLRGGPAGGPGRWKQLRGLLPGWLYGIGHRAEALTQALVLRGYRVDQPPEIVRAYRLGGREAAMLAGVVALVLAALW